MDPSDLRGYRQMCVYMNYKTIQKVNRSIAKTLCARDFKGFGTGFDTMNGVIEWREKIKSK